MSHPEWKGLLTELLKVIAKRLTSIGDYSSFRGVCSSWRAAASFDNFDRELTRVPLLIYFAKEREETPIVDGDIFAGKREESPVLGDALSEEREEIPDFGDDLAEEEEGNPNAKIVTNCLDLEKNTCMITDFPPAADRRYFSSSGWILRVSNDFLEVSLMHFMLHINIKLPNTFISSTDFITKMVLSGSPIDVDHDLLVMVIWGMDDQLAFCRPGDESWTVMDWWGGWFYDIIYHNKKLYALEHSLIIVECDIHGSNPTRIVQVFVFPTDDGLNFNDGVIQRFLVESFGKFLVVLRYMTGSDNHHFRTIEVELTDGSYNKIDNLEGRCLFLGLNSSICVDLRACAWSRVELNPNCIYFANTPPFTASPDCGIYMLCDGRFEDFSGMLGFCYPPPFWVVPCI